MQAYPSAGAVDVYKRQIDAGADKIRINPGNIGDDDRVKAVADACNAKNIPIRIGVNGGSLEKHILARYGAPVPEAMVESAMYHVHLLEKHDINNIVISIKSSNVPRMLAAYRLLASQTDYPCLLYTSPPLAALTFAASSIICAFGLTSAAPRSPYRRLELCGIALNFVFAKMCIRDRR